MSMLLTIDVGNTSIKLAVWERSNQLSFHMLDSKLIDFRSFILAFLYKANIRENQIDDTIIASVVPGLTNQIVNAIKEITGKSPIIVDSSHHYGIEIDESVKEEVGADILVVCAYTYQLLKKEAIIVSLGTATVLAHVTDDGKFKHCIIAPGFKTLAGSIFSNAALLPEFEAQKRNSFLATNTIDAMNVGVFDGFIGMIKYLIAGLKVELKTKPVVIGCGGAGKEVAPYILELASYNPDLVSAGLNYIYYKYYKR